MQTKRIDMGLSHLRRAAGLLPKHATVRFHLASALARSGDVKGARELLKTLLAWGVEFNEKTEAQDLLTQLKLF